MMDLTARPARRSFLALVGGATFSGVVQPVRAAQAPVLLLPAPTAMPTALPLLAAEKSHMHAFINIAMKLPDHVFEAWLEQGLWMAERCDRSAS